MTFTVALMIAVSYWGARDVRTPCHPTAINVTEAQMAVWDRGDGVTAWMRTDVGRCIVYVSHEAVYDRNIFPELYCAGLVHEVGHIDGLSHAHGGVMRADGWGHIPWDCLHPRRFLQRWRREHRG